MNPRLEFVIAAAVSYEGVTFSMSRPNRHHHIVHKLSDMGLPKTSYRHQGFITTSGRFVDRKEAAALVLLNGQVSKLKFVSDQLFSEDLW